MYIFYYFIFFYYACMVGILFTNIVVVVVVVVVLEGKYKEKYGISLCRVQFKYSVQGLMDPEGPREDFFKGLKHWRHLPMYIYR